MCDFSLTIEIRSEMVDLPQPERYSSLSLQKQKQARSSMNIKLRNSS